MPYEKIVAHSFGGPEVFALETVPDLPEPGAREVRIRVEAAGVGYTDTIVRRGKYIGYKGGLPVTPGYDVVGIVDALGKGVEDHRIGDRVADMSVWGGYTQYLVRPSADFVPVPAGVAPEIAVEVPLMWTTAWQMLTRSVTLAPGATILIVGASGSAGRALVLLARHLGLNVIGTCSAANRAMVEETGATAVDYRRADLLPAIRAASGGGGVVAAFDAIAGESWKTSWRALAKGGTLVGYGMQDFLESGSSSPKEAIRNLFRIKVLWPLLGKLDGSRRKALFYNIQDRRAAHPADFRTDVSHLLGLIASGAVTPAAPEILPLADAAEAHRRIDAGAVRHRLVLRP